jgi:hypothetical protein
MIQARACETRQARDTDDAFGVGVDVAPPQIGAQDEKADDQSGGYAQAVGAERNGAEMDEGIHVIGVIAGAAAPLPEPGAQFSLAGMDECYRHFAPRMGHSIVYQDRALFRRKRFRWQPAQNAGMRVRFCMQHSGAS